MPRQPRACLRALWRDVSSASSERDSSDCCSVDGLGMQKEGTTLTKQLAKVSRHPDILFLHRLVARAPFYTLSGWGQGKEAKRPPNRHAFRVASATPHTGRVRSTGSPTPERSEKAGVASSPQPAPVASKGRDVPERLDRRQTCVRKSRGRSCCCLTLWREDAI